jgi:hypothetical protein
MGSRALASRSHLLEEYCDSTEPVRVRSDYSTLILEYMAHGIRAYGDPLETTRTRSARGTHNAAG